MKQTPNILLITKLQTPNAGNQALSTELIRLLVGKYPDSNIYPFWQEPGLEKYTLSHLLASGGDPVQTLEKWADNVIDTFKKRNTHDDIQHLRLHSEQADYLNVVKLHLNIPSLPERLLNKGLRISRQLFSNQSSYGKTFHTWLHVISKADLVIFSPAGAMMEVCLDDRIRDLLILRIAQKFGAKIATVNQSVEITNPQVLQLIGYLYKSADTIVVRDPESVKRLTDITVPEEKITLAPDTAYLSQTNPMREKRYQSIVQQEKIEANTVGIALLPEKNETNFLEWGEVITSLRNKGKKVFFISHEYHTDISAGKELKRRYEIDTISQQYNYDEYIKLLSSLEMVISERYHTCVFSAIAGTPFVPVNTTKQRKMHGIVWSLEYPISPLDVSSDNWIELISEQTDYILNNYQELKQHLATAIPPLRKKAENNVPYLP